MPQSTRITMLQEAIQIFFSEVNLTQEIGSILSVQVDSRKVEKGTLFFALPGETTDGHLFLNEAVSKGAVGVVISEKYRGALPDGIIVLKSSDVLFSLQELARIYVAHSNPKIIGITGSVGKTTTKEFIRALIATEKKIFAPLGNMNSQIGMALALLNQTRGDEEWYLLEMAMTHPGNITRLIEIAPVDIAIVTSIEYVHSVNFADLESIAEAKAEIFSSPKLQQRVICATTNCLSQLIRGSDVPYTTYSTSFTADSDWFLERANGKVFVYKKKELIYRIPDPEFLSEPLYDNLLVAIMIAHTIGISQKNILCGIGQIVFPSHRMELVMRCGIFFLDDSYNACQVSMLAALEALQKLQKEKGGKSIAVLGEIRELGTFSESIHRSIGSQIPQKIDYLFCFGKEALYIHEEAEKRGIFSFWSLSFSEIESKLKEYVRQRDVVLLKGSFSNQLYRILESYTDSVELC